MLISRVGTLILAGLLLVSSAAAADICTLDRHPGATALLRYFELGSISSMPIQRTTLFSLTDTDASATIVHVAVWSEFPIPVLVFQIYLKGFDEQSVNMEDIVMHGVLPATALPADYPDLFPFCPPGMQFPLPFVPGPDDPAADPHPLTGQPLADFLQKALTGQPVNPIGGTPRIYASRDHHDDSLARGFVTIDVVDSCVSNAAFPGRGGYFDQGGRGIASNRNILIGDLYYVLRPSAFSPGLAGGINLVTLEASGTDRRTAQSPVGTPRYTFYAPFVGANGADNREPLATRHAIRFLNGGSFRATTDLVY